jgi:hypothetical protein
MGDSPEGLLTTSMGFGYLLGATPAVESATLRLKLYKFLEGAPIEVAHSNLKLLLQTILNLGRMLSVSRFAGYMINNFNK